LVVSYAGPAFRGFQIQSQGDTVQHQLEKSLQRICNGPIRVTPAGRTDAGVHASGQVVHFDTQSKIPCASLVKALNSVLPEAVRVLKAEEMDQGFHARYSAKKREYIYNFSFKAPVPLYLKDLVWEIQTPLAMNSLKQALPLLKGAHDFRWLCAAGDQNRSKVRNIYNVQLTRACPQSWAGSRESSSAEIWSLRITANGFLQKMVRLIVGFLVEIAQGKKTKEQLRAVLAGKKIAGTRLAAPAKGLCLVRVSY
jgi:tRNA pseudouridine38-40 synthase